MSSDLAFYTCYYLCQQQRVLCLKQTVSSSGDCPSPGPPAEVQSKLFSGPPRHNSHVFAANGLCSDHDAPDFPSVSGFKSKDKSMLMIHQKCDKASCEPLKNLFHFSAQLGTTSWLSGWLCAEAARTPCCFWAGPCSSAMEVLLCKWGNVLCAVSLRPSLIFSPAGESRSHRICTKQSVWHLRLITGEDIYSERIPPLSVYYDQEKYDGNNSWHLHTVTFYHLNLLEVCWNWCTNLYECINVFPLKKIHRAVLLITLFCLGCKNNYITLMH